MEIINLRHLERFQLASDVSNQRAQYYANVQKFSHNYVERCLRKCIFCPNGQIGEVCSAGTILLIQPPPVVPTGLHGIQLLSLAAIQGGQILSWLFYV